MLPIIKVVNGSLTDGNDDVLINASNTNADLGGGVSAAIRMACGNGFQEKIYEKLKLEYPNLMEPGDALLTDSGSHKSSKYVIHSAVMDYRDGFTAKSYPSIEILKRCYENSWNAIETIEDKNLKIAMVALGGGTGNVGIADTTELCCLSIKKHFEKNTSSKISEITFYGYNLHEYLVILKIVINHFEIDKSDLSDEILDYIK